MQVKFEIDHFWEWKGWSCPDIWFFGCSEKKAGSAPRVKVSSVIKMCLEVGTSCKRVEAWETKSACKKSWTRLMTGARIWEDKTPKKLGQYRRNGRKGDGSRVWLVRCSFFVKLASYGKEEKGGGGEGFQPLLTGPPPCLRDELECRLSFRFLCMMPGSNQQIQPVEGEKQDFTGRVLPSLKRETKTDYNTLSAQDKNAADAIQIANYFSPPKL